jgi:hypothetical protein
MNVEIGAVAALFLEKEYINGLLVAVYRESLVSDIPARGGKTGVTFFTMHRWSIVVFYCIFFVVLGAAVGSTVAAIPEHGAWSRGSGRPAGECSREIWQHAPTPSRVCPCLTTLRPLEKKIN